MLCGSNLNKKILQIGKLSLLGCINCKLMWLWPQTTSGTSRDYHKSLVIEPYIEYMEPLRVKQYKQEIENLSQMTSGKLLLDVGCAAGWFLKEVHETGFVTWGIEPQKKLAAMAKKNSPKSNILVGNLDTILKYREKFDVVTLWSVFEHFKDPQKSLLTLNKILKKGGVIAIRTPNSRGMAQIVSFILFRLSRGKISFPVKSVLQYDFESKHWFLFNQKNLEILLRKHGFEKVKVYYSTSVDWKNIEIWLESRKIRLNVLFIMIMKLGFLVIGIIGNTFRLTDDFVLFAVKK